MIRSARVTRELGDVAAKYSDSQAVEDSGGTILVIPAYPLPPGFNRTAVRIAIKVSGLYPSEKLDLLWIDPDLCRVDGSALPNVMASNVMLAGRCGPRSRGMIALPIIHSSARFWDTCAECDFGLPNR